MIDLRLRRDARCGQAPLAVILGLLELKRVLGRGVVRLPLPVIRLQHFDL
jgi:hypothetical protein